MARMNLSPKLREIEDIRTANVRVMSKRYEQQRDIWTGERIGKKCDIATFDIRGHNYQKVKLKFTKQCRGES